MAKNVPRSQPKRTATALSPEKILNATSPISKPETNLLVFFQTCIALWDTFYSEEEKNQIIATLPLSHRHYNKDENNKLLCPITPDFVISDQIFRENVARFQRDVSDGFWTVSWRSNAKKAAVERAEGKFDEFLMQHAEEMFGDDGSLDSDDTDGGIKSDRDYKAQRGGGGKSKGNGKKKGKGGKGQKIVKMLVENELDD